ncbi:hypothetical protein BC629DRAFT_1529829 [Irpex lacteus]|nr:hypothetical protein BC629DRAFT_1529829 [Irpex lacteus]
MHAAAACLDTHWGLPTAGARDPGSLCFHNSVVDRKPIVLSSPPPYRTCRDLIFVSLYARMLHCLELVSETKLQDYASEATFEDLKADAEAIYDRFVDTQVVDKLRDELLPLANSNEEPSLKGRDIVFENAVLFNRDALIMREYNDSIKAGDSGRIALSMKVLVRYYRGSGRTKYAYEYLMSVHNQTCVWPKPLRGIVFDNWVVNLTGHDNSFVPLDLLQEHQNFWIKRIYSAQGSNASWEWLQAISPCINTLRQLVSQFHNTLGSHQGSKHTTPDLTEDISDLMKSLSTHEVYTRQVSRTNKDSTGKANVVRDIMTNGLEDLLPSLREYNSLFNRLRDRRLMTPLISENWAMFHQQDRVGTASVDHSDSLMVPEAANATEFRESEAAARDDNDSEGTEDENTDDDGLYEDDEIAEVTDSDEEGSEDSSSLEGLDEEDCDDMLECTIEDDDDIAFDMD